jgi:hypothetical protein
VAWGASSRLLDLSYPTSGPRLKSIIRTADFHGFSPASILCPTEQRPLPFSAKVRHVTVPPYPYSIDDSRRLVTVPLSGSVHGASIAATYAAIYSDPGCGVGFDILWDGSTITELMFERDDLPSFVRLNQEFSALASSGRDIILVARSLDKAMADMYAVMMRGQRRAVHVCLSMQEVLQVRGA